MILPSSPGRLRGTFVLTALLAALSGCAGTAPRAGAPPGNAAPIDASAAATVDASSVGATATVPPTDAGDPALLEASAAVQDVAPDDGTAPAANAAAASDGRTQAELDYDAIYGQPYDPVADPTLPEPAQLPGAYDPWEPWNRKVYAFNQAVDRTIATPLARAYVKVVPRPVRLGVGNFFNNLGQPVSAVNSLLQGRPGQAGASLGRFVVNATLGIGGLFDPASRMGIPNRSEDFGQTLGVWGWQTSRYVELPLFGPRTVRDSFGLVGDGQLSPVRQVEDDQTRIFLQGLQLVDTRTQLFAVDRLREGAADEYALVRDAWMQRRDYQINSDRIRREEDDKLPDYLLDEESNPTVPVDVMPIVPGAPVP